MKRGYTVIHKIRRKEGRKVSVDLYNGLYETVQWFIIPDFHNIDDAEAVLESVKAQMRETENAVFEN